MTDKAVSALTSLTGANTATGDLLYIVDISEAAAADRSKKITAQELQNYLKKFPATIGVGGATPAASGAGISFPATASASSDANTLDDYEEGDCSSSIAIIGTSSNGTGTYSAKIANYVKVGRQVTVTGYLWWTAHTGTGDMRIAGLPFGSQNVSSGFQAITLWSASVAMTAGNYMMGYVYFNDSFIVLTQQPTGGGSSISVPMDTAGEIIFAATYISA